MVNGQLWITPARGIEPLGPNQWIQGTSPDFRRLWITFVIISQVFCAPILLTSEIGFATLSPIQGT